MTRAELLIFNLGYTLVLLLGYKPGTGTQNLQLDKAAASTAKSLAIYKDIFVSNSNLCKNKNYRMNIKFNTIDFFFMNIKCDNNPHWCKAQINFP